MTDNLTDYMKSLYKILHTTCHTGWGGLEKRIFNESVWMEKNGHAIIIVAPKDTPLYIQSKKHGFKVYDIAFKRLSFINDYQSLKRIFSNETPDIINTHSDQDSKIALLAARRENVPCRILSHHFFSYAKTSMLKKYIYRKISTYVFTGSDDISSNLKKTYNIHPLKIFNIPAGITPPIDRMLSKPEAEKKLIQKFSLGPNSRFIRVTANNGNHLDFDTLTKGLKTIESRLPDHHIVVTGLNPEVSHSKRKFKKTLELFRKNNLEHKFHFFPGQKDHWVLSNAFDCQITPVLLNKRTLVESIYHPLLMSMLCKCPVISDFDQTNDFLVPGQTCQLFHPNDPSNLADKILLSVNRKDGIEKQIQTAYDLVVKKYEMKTTCEYILKLYQIFKIKSVDPHWKNH